MTYVSIHNVLAKLNRDMGTSFEEADAIEWAGEALGHIDAPSEWDEVVSFVEVKNYRVALPTPIKSIRSIAKNMCYETQPASACPAAIIPADTGTDVIVTDCNGNIVNPCDYGRYLPSYSLDSYFIFSNIGAFESCYVPLRPATGTFFGALPTSIPNKNNLHPENDEEYKVQFPYIQFSFQEGFVAISYTRPKMDESGMPMIPDLESYREAIVKYVRLKLTQRKIDMGDQVAMNLLTKYEQDWHWYCKQARNEMTMHRGIGEWENKLQRSFNMLPPIHSFSSYFGYINRPYIQTYKQWQ
jgi:hypothetical protein